MERAEVILFPVGGTDMSGRLRVERVLLDSRGVTYGQCNICRDKSLLFKIGG